MPNAYLDGNVAATIVINQVLGDLGCTAALTGDFLSSSLLYQSI